jgi:homoserine O-acetyltransferase
MRKLAIMLGIFCIAAAAFAQVRGDDPGRGQRRGARRGQGRGQANYPAPVDGDFVIKDFKFRNGETMPELRLHYKTIGTPRTDANGRTTNAVYIMHGTTGSSSNFLVGQFAGELYGPGQLLDAAKYFIILPDGIGHGQSSKPSDGLHAKFPKYGYRDIIDADYRMLTEGLKVNHMRLVMGTSMGGMHTWLWGEMYPEYMDALMPLASLPGPISGRNRMWRKLMIDTVRNDPDWNGGDYTTAPVRSIRTITALMDFMGGNPISHQRRNPTLAQVDEAMEARVRSASRTMDVNDVMYAFAASEDYDPAPDLEKIQAPLIAINSADDLINPPELQILETNIRRVKNGRAVVIPLSGETVGHGSHTKAVLWKQYLEELLTQTESK